MLVSNLKAELESKRNDLNLKDSAKEIFENAIIKLTLCLESKKLSFNEIRELLRLIELPTKEAGYFLEFINTNSDTSSEIEDSHSEIYYAMYGKQVSCLHSLMTTETWRWIGGSDVNLYIIEEDKIEIITLKHENPEYTIKKNTLFGAKNANQDDESYSLVSCKCKPGFLMDYYYDPSPEEVKSLSKRFSKFSDIITELTPRAE